MNNTIRLVAIATLATIGTGANAALATYDTAASFAAAVTSPGIDDFSDLSTTAAFAGPLTRTAGSEAYTATTSAGRFAAATPGSSNIALTTVQSGASITFSGFDSSVTAIGARFFDTGPAGNYKQGTITVTATDVDGASFTETIAAATLTSFFGFTSDVAFSSLVVFSTGTNVWPTVDDLVLAQASPSAVPEPASVALLLAGVALIGTVARRRRTSNLA